MEYLPNGFTLNIPAGAFPLSTDSMALAHFVKLPRGSRVLDLGSGCGTLGLLLCAGDENCHVTGIELDAQTGLLYPSETLQLGVLRQPVYSNDELTWTSADPTIAMVENGLVTALREGETVITVTTASGFSATCTVTVEVTLLIASSAWEMPP